MSRPGIAYQGAPGSSMPDSQWHHNQSEGCSPAPVIVDLRRPRVYILVMFDTVLPISDYIDSPELPVVSPLVCVRSISDTISCCLQIEEVTRTYDGMLSFPVVAVRRSTESSILGSLACRAEDDSGDRLVIRGIVFGSVLGWRDADG